MRPPEHDVSSSERPRYVLVNSEQPENAGQRNQRPVHKEIGHQSIPMHEPAELRFERVLPSIESSPRTHLAVRPTEQRGRLYPELDIRAPERPSDRTFQVIDFDQGRDIQLMKRRRVDDQEVYSPRDPGRSLQNTSHNRALIPIGQSEAPRHEEHLVRLVADIPRTVPYMQQPAFSQPLGAANGSGQRLYLPPNKQAGPEPVAENGLDLPSTFQSPPSHIRSRRSLIEAEGPLRRPLSYSLSDRAPVHLFHESFQSAVSNPRELDSSRYGASTPYVSSRRYEIPPLDSLDHEIREEPARHGDMIMEREHARQVHEGPTGATDFQGQLNLYDDPRLEERGQIVYIPVRQEQGTPRVQHRPRAQLPLERSYQGLQSMTEVSQPRYQDAIHPAEKEYRRVTQPSLAVQSGSRPYPMYEDGHVEVMHSAAPRAGEKHAGLQGAPPGRQRYAMALECIQPCKASDK